MSDSSLSPESKCPLCGEGLLPSDRGVCHKCGTRVKEANLPKLTEPFFPLLPPLTPVERRPFQFSLSTLMLAMTLIALLTGLCVSFPGVGVPLTVLAIPAWVRTSLALQIEPPINGSAPSFGNRLDKFIVSIAAMVFVAIAVVIGFFGTCSVSGLVGAVLFSATNGSEVGFYYFVLVGGCLGAIVAGALMLRITWPKR